MTIAVVRKRNNKINMDGPVSSSINSRSTTIKTILLAAWRSKLTDEEWESRIRKVLPRGVNGDVYDLADCLLKQALIGPVPNQLFISYLKHAVQSELVSHSAVLRSIANQPINLRPSSLLLYRTSSIVCLLEFLKLFRDKISCIGTEIECLNLCHSLSNLTQWLLKCILQIIDHIVGMQSQQHHQSQVKFNNMSGTSAAPTPGFNSTANNQQNNTGSTNSSNAASNSSSYNNSGSSHSDATICILDLCFETIHHFMNRPFTKSLLFIDKVEHAKEFEDNILKSVQLIQQRLICFPQLQFIQEHIPHFNVLEQLDLTFNSRALHPSTIAAQQLRYLQTHRIRTTQITSSSNFEKKVQQYSASPIFDSSTNYALFNSLYPLVAFDAILRPTRLYKHLARQIVTITTFNTAPANMTYCELIRVCLIGLIDAHGNPKAKASWSFFIVIKLPRLLIELNKLFMNRLELSSRTKSITEPNQASNFINDLEQAFERLSEYSPLLDETEYKCKCDFLLRLVKELKKNDPSLEQLKEPPARHANNQKNPFVTISRYEQVAPNMLETLNSVQDPADLFSILSEFLKDSSFEYTLDAAAATGRIHQFVTRVVERNELYKLPQDIPSPKNIHAQALNFDITFLILIYVAHRYGPELIDKTKTNLTFNKWYHECYNQESSFSCPKEMLKKCDSEIVTSLIKQLVNRDYDIQMKSVNWHDVCFNLPMAINEILNAWTQGGLNDEDINLVIERLHTKMCFMAVVAATWLQCHLRTLDDAEKAKPIFFLSNLTKTIQLIKRKDSSGATNLMSDGYVRRSSLMGEIIKQIYSEVVPGKVTPNSSSSSSKGCRQVMTSTLNSSVGSNSTPESEDSYDKTAYHSYKNRFTSILTTQEIFIINVRQCFNRGWIDYDSLNSLSSLFKIIGSESTTNLIVDQILTSHESPTDLSRAVNITFGLLHLDIEACAFALIKETIPNWLMGEKKQSFLNQPRAFALANLAVMAIIEVYHNLTTTTSRSRKEGSIDCGQDRSFALNGTIKQEPGVMNQSRNLERIIDNIEASSANASLNGSVGAKRARMMQDDVADENECTKSDKVERLNRLNYHVSDLMRLFKEIMSDSVMSHRTLFPLLFLQQTVVCAREEAKLVTIHLQPEILLDMIDLFSSEMTFELVLAISSLSSTNSRKYTAKAICKLAQIKELDQRSQFSSDGNSGETLSDVVTSEAQVGNARISSTPSASGAISSGRSAASSVPMIIG